MRRVVVTGLGIISSIGVDVNSSWNNLINGKSGIGKITKFPIDGIQDNISKIAGEIPDELFDPSIYIEKKELKKMGQFIWYALAATEQALNDAEWKPTDISELQRTGVVIGSGIGGLGCIQDTSITFMEKGIKKISPFFIPQSLINLAPGQIAIKYGFMGPNISTVTACASSNHAIGEAGEIIKRGDADIIIAGGAESSICEIGIGGFSAMRALSTNFNNDPEKASRPWDKARDGFVMGEGAGILVLEELEHAKKRGAKIYAELSGYGMSCDAYHMTSPHAEGAGAKLAINMALNKANMNPDEISYINAHGTSTPVGDLAEFKAIKDVFKNSLNNIMMSSTKSSIGHLLGAAGAVEAIFSIKAIETNVVPPTLNLEDPDDECVGIDLVPLKAKEKQVNAVLSNSFGFGGTNASLIFKRFTE